MACELEDQALMLAKMAKAQTAAVKATADAADELARIALEIAQTASDLCHSTQQGLRAKKLPKKNNTEAIMDCMLQYAKAMAKLTVN